MEGAWVRKHKRNCEFGFGLGEHKVPLNFPGAEAKWRDEREALTDIKT